MKKNKNKINGSSVNSCTDPYPYRPEDVIDNRKSSELQKQETGMHSRKKKNEREREKLGNRIATQGRKMIMSEIKRAKMNS